jgi:hypothetical protein
MKNLLFLWGLGIGDWGLGYIENIKNYLKMNVFKKCIGFKSF